MTAAEAERVPLQVRHQDARAGSGNKKQGRTDAPPRPAASSLAGAAQPPASLMVRATP